MGLPYGKNFIILT